MNLSVKDAEYILAIITEGNLTRAAQRLYISQPSLSITVQKIERQLGVKLFTRENNRLKPTYEGKRFAEACSSIVKTCRDVETEFADIRQSSGGKVTIGMPFNLICYVFPLIYQICQEKYPDLQLIPAEGDTRSRPPKGANYYYINQSYDPGWEVAVLYRKSACFSSACSQCVDILTQLFQNTSPSGAGIISI